MCVLNRAAVRVRQLLEGFWLVPGLVLLAFAGAAFAAIELDRRAGSSGVGWAYRGDAEAARQTLGVVAGSLITVAGVTFSITIVTLQLVSSQYTPRALRSFLADRVNQVIAGTYVGIFVFCLLALRVVENTTEDEDGFVPSLAVTIAIVSGLVGFALILFFVHHMAQSIKVSHIAARIARDTFDSIENLYPAEYGRPDAPDEADVLASWRTREPTAVVAARETGYVQAITLDDVAGAVGRGNAHVIVRVGEFVARGEPVVAIWGGEPIDERTRVRVQRAIAVGVERDLDQDLDYGIRQLTDIALRALSPGLNDPTTAINCIRYLGATLAAVASRQMPEAVRRIGDATVAVAHRTFRSHLEEPFRELSRFAAPNVRVTAALIEALETIADAASQAGAAERVAVVGGLAAVVAEPALAEARTAADREELEQRLARVAYTGTSL